MTSVDTLTATLLQAATKLPLEWFVLAGSFVEEIISPIPTYAVMVTTGSVARLQAEPWVYKTFYDVPLAEQEKTMNIDIFKANISYAKQTGFDEFYLWGVEWWYWLKTTQNQPQIWNEAKKLF